MQQSFALNADRTLGYLRRMEKPLGCRHYGPVWNDQTTNRWSKK